jgi:hypothetical protein
MDNEVFYYFLVVSVCFIGLLWWACLFGVGRTSLSIKSLAALLFGFALIFAIASHVFRLFIRPPH